MMNLSLDKKATVLLIAAWRECRLQQYNDR